jgi:hypothetical protein
MLNSFVATLPALNTLSLRFSNQSLHPRRWGVSQPDITRFLRQARMPALRSFALATGLRARALRAHIHPRARGHLTGCFARRALAGEPHARRPGDLEPGVAPARCTARERRAPCPLCLVEHVPDSAWAWARRRPAREPARAASCRVRYGSTAQRRSPCACGASAECPCASAHALRHATYDGV